MTKEQIRACEKLSNGSGFPAKPYFIQGFKAAQRPEMLILNPLVKELVEALEWYISNCDCGCSSTVSTKALAPFKEGE